MIQGHAVDVGEDSPDENLAVGLDADGMDRTQRRVTGVRVKGRVHRTIQIQPHQVMVRDAVERNEIAAHNHLAVRLHGQGVNRPVGAGDTASGVEVQIHLAGAGQAGHSAALHAVEVGETAANEIGAHGRPVVRRRRQESFRDGVDRVVRAGAGVKGGVQRAVLIQPRNVVEGDGVEVGEASHDHDGAVGLARIWRLAQHLLHQAVGPRLQVEEAGVHRSVRIEPRHLAQRKVIDEGEKSARQNLSVRLQAQRVDDVVEADPGKNGGVH